MEIWLEPVGDGTVVHWYLRADPPTPLARGARPGGSASAGCGLEGGTPSRSRTGLEGAERVT